MYEDEFRCGLIYIRDNFEDIFLAFKRIESLGGSIFIVTDNNVKELHLNSFLTSISDVVTVKGMHVIKPGEESKNSDTVSEIYKAFSAAGVDRKTVAVALGGGVVGDICGFAASTFMRGIPYVQIPTTLMAMVDSSVGGKTGINFEGHKNLVGSFYQPKFVYINIGNLKTLPREQFLEGMAEVIKYGLIHDAELFGFLIANVDKISDDDIISYLIRRSVEIKDEIVSKDEKEIGVREILNFGHTFGHSIESLLKYKAPHGFCVGLGMTVALNLSIAKGYIGFDVFEKYIYLCKKLGIPSKISDLGFTNIDADDIYENMRYDKKVRNGKIRFVLLKSVEDAFVDELCEKDEVILSIDSIL
ncbi:MAG: 3-dehydroquinate synthase [Defluviitaleaceae bacterium]|nr:3-dehydroquinate synthase [Defluviitaleaceae bacterium]